MAPLWPIAALPQQLLQAAAVLQAALHFNLRKQVRPSGSMRHAKCNMLAA